MPDDYVNPKYRPHVAPLPKAAQRTIPGLQPPPLPPVSLPETEPTSLRLPDGSHVKRDTLRRLWIFVAPVVITAGTSTFGYIKGKALGYIAAQDEVAQLKEAQARDHRALVTLAEKVKLDEDAAAQEAESNRQERATALERWRTLGGDFEDFKKGLPRIQGLSPKK